jgi:hypothetical protein
MLENSKKIIETITPIIKALLDLIEAFFILTKRIVGWAAKAIEIFKTINKATSGWAGYILAAVAAWKILNILFLASPVGRLILLGTTLALLVDDFLGFQEGMKSAIDWGTTLNKIILALTASLVAFKIALLLANPAGLIISAIGIIIAAAYLLIENWQKVKDWFTPFFDWMIEGFRKIGSVIDKVVNTVKVKFDVDDTGLAKASRDAFAQSTRRLSTFGSVPLTQGNSSSVKQSVNQDIKITVNGADSPEATGRAIYNEQSRINADLTRNFAGAVR